MAFEPIDPNKAEVRITGEAPNYGLDFYIPRGERGAVGPVGPMGPAVPTQLAIGEVVTGPETAGATGPQGIQGLKGDPGGIVLGTLVANNTDINTLVNDGVYRFVNPTGITNGPPILYGVMYVNNSEGNTARVNQTFYPSTTGTQGRYIATRGLAGGIWQPWRIIAATRIDQTAGRAIYQYDHVNDRDQMIYGDTGWRELSASMLNGWTATSALIRRYNNIISFKLYQLNPAAATSDVFYLLPAGFVRTHGAGVLLFPKTASEVAYLNLASTGLQFNPRGSTNFGTGGFTEVQWSTTDAWPTTLPGTASGTVPNI